MPVVSNDDVSVYYEGVGIGEPMVLLHVIFQTTIDWIDAGHVNQLQDECEVAYLFQVRSSSA